MTEIAKVCIRHGELTEEQVRRIKFKNRNYVKCHQCEIDRSRRYYKEKYKDPEWRVKKKAADKEHWRKRKEKIMAKRQSPEGIAKRHEYYEKRRDIIRQQTIERGFKYRDELTDAYVRKQIKNDDKTFDLDLIIPEMVELKRAIIKLNRVVKKVKKGEEV